MPRRAETESAGGASVKSAKKPRKKRVEKVNTRSRPRKKGHTLAQKAAGRKNIKKALAARAEKRRRKKDQESIRTLLGKDWITWRAEVIKKRKFDPLGFLEKILEGNYQCKLKDAAGVGDLGIGTYKPRSHQIEHLIEIAKHRRYAKRGRYNTLIVKSRQMGFSVGHSVFIMADAESNANAGGIVTAHQNDTLVALSENFDAFVGGQIAKLSGRMLNLAMKRLKTKAKSVISLHGPTDSLARGDAPLHLLVSEADYIGDLDAMLNSVLPSLNRSVFGSVTLESTIRRASTSGFRDFLARSRRGETVFKVLFLGWVQDETAREEVDEERLNELRDSLSKYENMLKDDHDCDWEQISWWRSRFEEDARSDLQQMIEMYPATLDEALSAGEGTAFLSPEASQFQKDCVCDPIERRLPLFESFETVTNPRVWFNRPHVAIWERPEFGVEYVIGGDGADATDRKDLEIGSKSYVVVLNVQTGVQVAEWHGYTNPVEFAVAMWRLQNYYNDATLVIENPHGRSAIDYLTGTLDARVHEREIFGKVIQTLSGVYGFDPARGARQVMIGRLQDNWNRRAVVIRSELLQAQVVNAGKRHFKPNRTTNRTGEQCDDGVTALLMCMTGHRNAVGGVWQVKDVMAYGTLPARRVDTTADAHELRLDWLDDDEDDEEDRNLEADAILGRT